MTICLSPKFQLNPHLCEPNNSRMSCSVPVGRYLPHRQDTSLKSARLEQSRCPWSWYHLVAALDAFSSRVGSGSNCNWTTCSLLRHILSVPLTATWLYSCSVSAWSPSVVTNTRSPSRRPYRHCWLSRCCLHAVSLWSHVPFAQAHARKASALQ